MLKNGKAARGGPHSVKVGKQASRQSAIEAADIARKLWKTKIEGAMKLAQVIATVLYEPFTQAHDFRQFVEALFR